MTKVKELNAIEKLEAVKLAMEAFGYSFEAMTVAEAFTMFRTLDNAMQLEMSAMRQATYAAYVGE
jgi:hypothetical protein